MYEMNSALIAGVLLIFMLAAMRLGLALGKPRIAADSEERKSQTLAVQGSLLGLLGLLLGFSFSLALARFDERSRAVVAESNAIGTAFLRTELLPEPARDAAKKLLAQYAEHRILAATVSAADEAQRHAMIAEAEAVFAQVWTLASDNARASPGPVSMGLVTALNDMIDALSTRNAVIERHVPEIVMYLLFATFVMLGGVVGYSSSMAGISPGMPVYAMLTMIVLMVFLIIDLDRPRRGLIEVDQAPLRAVAASMRSA